MEEFHRQAVVIELIEALQARGSWCGETHVQKCAFVLEAGLAVPLDLGFILYKHGPFSFELRELLGEMRGNFLIDVRSRPPYGPSLIVSKPGQELAKRFPKTLEAYRAQITFVAEKLSDHGVAGLERLGTALFVITEHPNRSSVDQAQLINDLKPHVPEAQAGAAIEEMRVLLAEARDLLPPAASATHRTFG